MFLPEIFFNVERKTAENYKRNAKIPPKSVVVSYVALAIT